jgi:predicted amidohydrolase YtcJ
MKIKSPARFPLLWALLCAPLLCGLLLCGLGLLLAGCDSEDRTASNAPPVSAETIRAADTVYLNARVWTGDGSGFREAIAVSGEKILAVGSTKEIQSVISSDTLVVDLGGQLVVPGFIDNHTHFILSALAMQRTNLRDADSPEEFSRRIAEQARAHPGEWIIEGNWDHELWGGALPTRQWIDAATKDTPVFVLRLDRHMALANSVALRLAGIDENTVVPEGGEIVRNENGQITGLLKDKAMGLVDSVIPLPTEAQVDAALDAATELALSKGVTQIHDMGEWGHLQAFLRAREQGRLRLRVYQFSLIEHAQELADYIAANGRGDDWLRWGGVKGFVDGSLGSTTAWFNQPYDDAPETSGLTKVDPDLLASQIAAADALGLQVTVHAIGDRANNWLLDTYAAVFAANGPRDRRFRIEHAQHLTAAAIPRFAELGVIPSMQPYHAIDDGRWAEKRIGPERIKTTYAFKSLLDAGASLTFGSDWAVAPIDTMVGIYAAVTRRTIDGLNPDGWVPEQKISVEDALRVYTRNNAYAGFQEDRLGTIAPGFLADFVVLSADIFTINPHDLADVKVQRTVVGGKDAYVAPLP